MSVVKYEVRDHIGYITLNRPDKLNAINPEMREELYEAFSQVKDNPEVWLALVTGTGRAFTTGHDLVAMASPGSESGHSTDDLYLLESTLVKPVLVAVNGYCFAQGCGIVLTADIAIASEQAQFGWPQVKRGISSVSGPVFLANRVPWGRAMQILLTGDSISAQEALQLGLVNKVVPHERLLEETEALARNILANAPLSIRAMKEAAQRGQNKPLAERIKIASGIFAHIKDTEDAKEGLAAFREKRQPVWKGR
ncbi:MAG: enoyl-CoA hydratase/isomerase family protein [Chloroflexi bacterium]|nr:enoyl-CoA hydratase/isomerase family protein [Chloroflexota bacterium]